MKSKFIEFYGEECPGCKSMRRTLDRVELEMNVHFERIEVWHNKENDEYMTACDKGRCNGLPLIYNSEKDTLICGEAPYDEVVRFINS